MTLQQPTCCLFPLLTAFVKLRIPLVMPVPLFREPFQVPTHAFAFEGHFAGHPLPPSVVSAEASSSVSEETASSAGCETCSSALCVSASVASCVRFVSSTAVSASVAARPVASISLLPSCFGKTPSDVLPRPAMLCATFPVSSTVCPSTKTPCCVSGTRTASASADKVFGLGKGFDVCCEVGFRLVIITTFFFFTVISLFVGMFPCVETVCGNYFFVLCKSVIFLLMYALCAQILL